MTVSGYIYIVILREFILNKTTVYKIGYTRDIITRLAHYPKGSKLLFCQCVDDPKSVETAILGRLRESFVNRTDIGSEYFEGDFTMIARLCHDACNTKGLEIARLEVVKRKRGRNVTEEDDEAEPMDIDKTTKKKARAAK